MTDVLKLPADHWSGPHCGVTAIAVLSGHTFQEVWDYFKKRKGPRWKGTLLMWEFPGALFDFGVESAKFQPRRRMTLETWVSCYSQPGTTYAVQTTGHMQVVRDRYVMDQAGLQHISQARGRRKFVKSYFVTTPV